MAIQCIPVRVIALLEGIRVGLGNLGQIRSSILGEEGKETTARGGRVRGRPAARLLAVACCRVTWILEAKEL